MTVIGQVFTHKNALLLNHSNIFSKLVVCTETTSPKNSFFYKIQTKYKLIKMLFSFLIVIKLLIPMWWYWNLNKIILVCVYVYNLKVSNFQIGCPSDFNRKWSIFWNWTGRRFQRLEIRLVAKIGCWNQMSKSALTVLCHIFLWTTGLYIYIIFDHKDGKWLNKYYNLWIKENLRMFWRALSNFSAGGNPSKYAFL